MHRWRNAGRSAAVAASAMLASMLVLIAAVAALAQTSPAQTWPTKRVQVIVPFSPGSATDLLPRTVFEHVSAKTGQTFIIENRPGGGGAMGVSAVAKAEPDGHTILVHSNALVTAPAIQNMPYDPVQDFAGITPLGNVPLVLVISPDKNIKTLKELVAAAKAKPGSINYAAAGIGTPPHLTTERFRLAAQFEGQLVPFKGAPEALTEVLTGRVDFYFCRSFPRCPSSATASSWRSR
jgi:tripartite-type tricarboxylate transporter receptor subunit TctC